VRKIVLADVPYGRVVRFAGRWGVVCRGGVIDFWDGGRERVKPWSVVEVQA